MAVARAWCVKSQDFTLFSCVCVCECVRARSIHFNLIFQHIYFYFNSVFFFLSSYRDCYQQLSNALLNMNGEKKASYGKIERKKHQQRRKRRRERKRDRIPSLLTIKVVFGFYSLSLYWIMGFSECIHTKSIRAKKKMKEKKETWAVENAVENAVDIRVQCNCYHTIKTVAHLVTLFLRLHKIAQTHDAYTTHIIIIIINIQVKGMILDTFPMYAAGFYRLN